MKNNNQTNLFSTQTPYNSSYFPHCYGGTVSKDYFSLSPLRHKDTET